MDFKLPTRKQDSNKGTFGKVLNIAGSKYMPGAAYLSSVSALKIGCGYCFLCSEESVLKTVANQTQNVVFLPLSELKKHIKTSDVLEIGCGLSTSLKSRIIFKTAIRYSNIPTIIDADGINILSEIKSIKLPKSLILTPHPKEASRLLKKSVDDILSNIEDSAKEISKKYNCITVLKSHHTIVCSKELEIYKNKTGNSSLAKAGSGDVLTGIISGLISQKMDLFEAAKLGVYLHGRSGELASKNLSEYSVMAEDIINYLPNAILELTCP